MKQETLVRKQPRISINKLAEYLTCTPRKRNTIIENQKRPSAYKSAYYQPTRSAIVEFLARSDRDHTIISDAIQTLKNTSIRSDYHRHQVTTNIEALGIFNDTYNDTLNLDEKEITKGDWDPPKLNISDVDVSVRPDLISHKNINSTQQVGAIKLYFKKNDPLKAKAGKYTATALHSWIKQHLASTPTKAPKEDAIVYDVFSGRTISAPNAHINRGKDISAACNEISALWPHM